MRSIGAGSFALLLCLAHAAALAPDARAEEVIELESPPYFVEAFGSYVFRDVAQSTVDAGGSSLTRFEERSRAWSLGGAATIPIALGFGARATVAGGKSREELPTLGVDRSSLGGGIEAFWRDPTIGRFGVGYAYGKTDENPAFSFDSRRVHTLPVSVAFYLPDLSQGPVDWTLDFDYSWLDVDLTTGNVSQWAYAFEGASYWYINDIAGFRGGVRYERSIAAQPSNTIEGVFRIEILIPSGPRRFGTISLVGGVGRVEEEDLPAPFSTISRLTYQVGVVATVHFPGVASLVELNRAYR